MGFDYQVGEEVLTCLITRLICLGRAVSRFLWHAPFEEVAEVEFADGAAAAAGEEVEFEFDGEDATRAATRGPGKG